MMSRTECLRYITDAAVGTQPARRMFGLYWNIWHDPDGWVHHRLLELSRLRLCLTTAAYFAVKEKRDGL